MSRKQIYNSFIKFRKTWNRKAFLKGMKDEHVDVNAIPYGELTSQIWKTKRMNFQEYVKKYFDRNANKNDEVEKDKNINEPFNYVFDSEILKRSKYGAKLLSSAKHLRPYAGEDVTNFQLGLGGVGRGAPIHYHNYAFAHLVVGEKLWIFNPPRYTLYSNNPISMEMQSKEFKKRSENTLFCTQYAGDILFVPRLWSHGTLTLKPSLSFSDEFGDASNPAML